MLIVSVSELVMKKGGSILTHDGIEVRDNGWNPWETVNGFLIKVDTYFENGNKEYLIIQLSYGEELKCLITDLDKSQAEIVVLINLYRNAAGNNKK